MGKRDKPVDPKLTRRQSDKARAAIQTSSLINLLQANAQGTLKNPKGESYELSAGRIKSAQIILAKTLPDMRQIEYIDATERKSRQELEAELERAKKEFIQSLTQDELLEAIEQRSLAAKDRHESRPN